jgi:hypothetical protein
MKGRLRAKIAVPPHWLSVNPRYQVGEGDQSHIENHNGAIFRVEANCPQRADLWLFMKQLHMTAGEVAVLIGKPPRQVKGWARHEGSPDAFIPLSQVDVRIIESAIAAKGPLMRGVDEYRLGKVIPVLIL